MAAVVVDLYVYGADPSSGVFCNDSGGVESGGDCGGWGAVIGVNLMGGGRRGVWK